MPKTLFVIILPSLFYACGPGAISNNDANSIDAARGKASCQIVPNPVLLGQSYTIQASGLAKLAPIILYIQEGDLEVGGIFK